MLRPLAWLALPLLLAGCIGAPGDGAVEVVGREQAFVVHVLGPDEPVRGEVRVNLFWKAGDALYRIGGHAHDGEAVFHLPKEVAEIRLRAGGDGWANDVTGVQAAAADGQATVRIYPAQVAGRLEGVWRTPNPPANPLPVPEDVAVPSIWQMHDVTPGATEEARAGFQSRLVRANATLAWSNGVGAQADFGAGLVRRDAGDRCAFADRDNQFGVDGEAQESLEASDRFDFDPCPAYLLSGDSDDPVKGLLAGPMARGAVLGAVGYAMDYRLEFGDMQTGDAFEFNDGCPACDHSLGDPHYEVDPETGEARLLAWPQVAAAPPALAAIAVLLAATLAMRRRTAS